MMTTTRLLALLALLAFSSNVRAQDHTPHEHAQATPGATAPATAQAPQTPAGAALTWIIKGLAGTEEVQVEGKFAPSLLQQVPEAQLAAVINNFRRQSNGLVLRSVTEASPHRLVAALQANADDSFWRIIISVQEAAPHLFDGLLFQPAHDLSIPPINSWDHAYEILADAGERSSLVIYEVADDGALEPVYEQGGDQRLAIGSTFKLWIAGALAEAVAAGEFEWDQKVKIEDRLRSLPSGRMQDLAHGEERPLEEYATLMIAISDNTATDHMLDLVGRERVEAFMSRFVAAPERNIPFLSTREMFAIKLSDDPELMQRYAAADADLRREILQAEVEGVMPDITSAAGWQTPRAIDTIEWFATGEELCRTLAALWEMSEREGLSNLRTVMSSNNGIGLSAETWPQVMFKGGSEPGVMNLTWVLEHADGRRFAVSMTVNDTGSLIEEMKVVGLAQRVMERLAE